MLRISGLRVLLPELWGSAWTRAFWGLLPPTAQIFSGTFTPPWPALAWLALSGAKYLNSQKKSPVATAEALFSSLAVEKKQLHPVEAPPTLMDKTDD